MKMRVLQVLTLTKGKGTVWNKMISPLIMWRDSVSLLLEPQYLVKAEQLEDQALDDNQSEISLDFNLDSRNERDTEATVQECIVEAKKTDNYENKLIEDWLKEIDMRYQNESAMEDETMDLRRSSSNDNDSLQFPNQQTKLEQQTKIQTLDPNSIYMASRNESLIEKQINQNRLATKYPVFKDVKGQWSYNYEAEEKKKFKGELAWDPNKLQPHVVDEYLREVAVIWPKCTGMKEEIALKILVINNFNVEVALSKLKSRETSLDIVRLINEMTQHDAKIEFLKFLTKLL
ncbi:UNKNOWN [Stylonychia lemnae]|uniref:ELM2 domain-containing protein n=1 Tax=Stylonychia lemnae TaxID=5949 RepID=A0A078A8H9_STYLE|nr:UNKNOWN [Stylonychia lemnae]|eukprot:CDW78176.1 UNKNOWN [Stylonychia lemnae]